MQEPNYDELNKEVTGILVDWYGGNVYPGAVDESGEDCAGEIITKLWRGGWLREEPIEIEDDLQETQAT